MTIAYAAPRSLTLYPLVRLAQLAALAGAGLERFNFSDLQAATGFDLREGQLAVNTLSALGILERVGTRRDSRPVYAWSHNALPLFSPVRVQAPPVGTPTASFVAHVADILRDDRIKGRFTVFGLQCQAVAADGALHLEGEALVRVHGKKDIARDLVALRERLTRACVLPVNLSLQWLP